MKNGNSFHLRERNASFQLKIISGRNGENINWPDELIEFNSFNVNLPRNA